MAGTFCEPEPFLESDTTVEEEISARMQCLYRFSSEQDDLSITKSTQGMNKMGCFNDPAWKVCGWGG